jgi:hypothetical protein
MVRRRERRWKRLGSVSDARSKYDGTGRAGVVGVVRHGVSYLVHDEATPVQAGVYVER